MLTNLIVRFIQENGGENNAGSKEIALIASTSLLAAGFLLLHFIFVLYYYFTGVTPLFIFNICSVAVYIAATVLNQRGKSELAVFLINSEVCLYCVFSVYVLGWQCSTQWYLPAAILPCQLIYPVSRNKRAACIGMLVLSMGLCFFMYDRPAPYSYIDMKPIAFFNLLVLTVGMAVSVRCKECGEKIMALYYSQRIDALAEGAYIDSLTGLYNRRYALEKLDEMGAGAYLIGMIDIDNFKRVNDTYGHPFGDQVLEKIGGVLRSKFTNQDVAIRWGGEEFLLIVADPDIDAVVERIEQLRLSIEETVFIAEGETIHITVTIGLCVCKENEDVNSIIENSDKALYYGKSTGKNRIILFREGRFYTPFVPADNEIKENG